MLSIEGHVDEQESDTIQARCDMDQVHDRGHVYLDLVFLYGADRNANEPRIMKLWECDTIFMPVKSSSSQIFYSWFVIILAQRAVDVFTVFEVGKALKHCSIFILTKELKTDK